jgi:hypothetical protein
MDVTATEVRAVLAAAGWDPADYGVRESGGRVSVALGLDLTYTTPAAGGNAAGSLVAALRAAGFDVSPGGWEHLLAGGESAVTRLTYPTPAIAVRMYGDGPSRAQLTAAAQWLRSRGIQPVNPGTAPLLWPAGAVDAALDARAAMLATGKRNPGNRTARRGTGTSASAEKAWETRRAGDGS